MAMEGGERVERDKVRMVDRGAYSDRVRLQEELE